MNRSLSIVFPIRIVQFAVIALILIVTLLLAGTFTARAIPSTPTLIGPANFSTITVASDPPQAVPFFQWQPVTGATQYEIQIADNIGFSGGIAYDVGLQGTRYIPTSDGAFTDKVWFWRVRAQDNSGWGDWSYPWQFTRSWSSGNAVALSAPPADATVEFFEAPVFSWSPAVGASAYELKVGQDPLCQSSPNSINVTTVATQFTPASRLYDGNYYWWVVPLDANNHEGNPGECRHMVVAYSEIPALLSPANFSTPPYTPKFQWTAVKGAFAYNLYYGTTSNFQNGTFAKVTTSATTYTPDSSLPNDQTTYWKVTAVYGGYWEGPASSVYQFQKHWAYNNHQPIILTPRNNELVNVPLFSWTPVREAKYYVIEASFDAGFGSILWSDSTPNTYYWRNQWDPSWWGMQTFLRVRPYDNNGNPGLNSVQITYVPTYSTALPEALFPRYYYSPPSITTTLNYTVPYNIPVSYDYTQDTPTFYWSRTFVPGVDPRVEADHYKLEVSSDPSFSTVEWTYQTQNLSASPTDGAPFVPISNTNYYWRVTPYDQFGAPLANSATNEKWMTQIDLSRRAAAVASTSPLLLRPAYGEKAMDTLPSFEWQPQQGAVRYQFEMGTNSALASTVYTTTTIYTHHTPNVRLPKGTYFWRVCGLNGANDVVGVCTSSQRLVVAFETRWSYSRAYPSVLLTSTLGTLIASDTNDGLGAPELTTLYSAQDSAYWYIGFNVNPVLTGTVWYGLYLDGDQTDFSGANVAPPGRPQITTSPYYQPEFAIYVGYSNTQFITNNVPLYNWNKSNLAWDPVRNLVDPVQVSGGAFTYSPTLNYVELRIPKTAIGDLGSSPFMLSMALFSATSNAATTAADTVPDNGHSINVLSEFKSIADRVNLAQPPDSPVGSPSQVPYTPFMYAETPNADNLKGFKVEVAQDPGFTQILDTLDSTCNNCAPYVDIFQFVYSPLKSYLDKTLYWRYTIKHTEMYPDGGRIAYSPPSEPHSFTKVGLTPMNPQVTGLYGMPTFQWDPVESAAQYELRVSTNPQFSPVSYDRTVNHENFTPNDFSPIPGQTYYWQVRMINSFNSSYQSAWSITSTIQITYPRLTAVTPAPNGLVHSTPQFSWQSILTPGGQPVWGSSKYHLQVATSANGFSSPFEDVVVDTINWTPYRSYADGTYYWRVAVRDPGNYDGPFTAVYSFTKQYPFVTILSPQPGSDTGRFPLFSWAPVSGAAHYQIQTGTDPQYSHQLEFQQTDNTIYVPVNPYQPAFVYWRVRMLDHDNNPGPWTDSTVAVNPLPNRVYLPMLRK